MLYRVFGGGESESGVSFDLARVQARLQRTPVHARGIFGMWGML